MPCNGLKTNVSKSSLVTWFCVGLAFLMTVNQSLGQNMIQSGWFPTVQFKGKVYKKWDYSVFGFAAVHPWSISNEGSSMPSQVFMAYGEVALGYQLTNHWHAAMAYVYESQSPFQRTHRNENRCFAQLTHSYPLDSSFTMVNRLRWDQRWIQQINAEYQSSSRIRYLLGLEKTISKGNLPVYVTAYNEFFFQTSFPQNAFYTENWAHVGLGIKTPKLGTFEVGPLYITWVQNAIHDRLHLVYLQMVWTKKLDLTK